MSKIYHYAIGLHTAAPPNTNLVKAHERKAMFIGRDLKPTIFDNHLMVDTAATGEAVIKALLGSTREKYGQDASLEVVYVDVTDSEKHKSRFSEDRASIESLLSAK